MIEDKLSHDERLRLECVAQANNTIQQILMRGSVAMPANLVVAVAEVLEDYVRDGTAQP